MDICFEIHTKQANVLLLWNVEFLNVIYSAIQR